MTLALLTLGTVGLAEAGSVTTHESELDAIYSQSSFGANPIDIRFDPTQTVFNTALLTLDTDAEFDSLSTYAVASSKIVSIFFVDHINACDGVSPNIVGCGSDPGNLIALDSSFAAGALGAAAIGHELGHNLGLDHIAGQNTNLMNPIVYNGAAPAPLTSAQVSKILTSPLVQTDAQGHKYIEITPFAVVASVPEPSVFVLMALGLGLIVFVRKRSAFSV
jgi:hypothetical protein